MNIWKKKIKIPISKKAKADKEKNTGKNEHPKENTDDFGKFQKFFAFIQAFYDSSDRIRKTVIIEKLRIKAEYGTTDAAFTGTAVGLAYAEIYKLIGFLSAVFTVYPPDITITPVFEDRYVFLLEAEGIIKTKIAHIIFTAIKFYFSYKKALNGKD